MRLSVVYTRYSLYLTERRTSQSAPAVSPVMESVTQYASNTCNDWLDRISVFCVMMIFPLCLDCCGEHRKLPLSLDVLGSLVFIKTSKNRCKKWEGNSNMWLYWFSFNCFWFCTEAHEKKRRQLSASRLEDTCWLIDFVVFVEKLSKDCLGRSSNPRMSWLPFFIGGHYTLVWDGDCSLACNLQPLS